MKACSIRFIGVILLLVLACGCANIVPPTGGAKDTTPPQMLSITPKDSMLDTRVTRIEMRFDEFVTVTDAGKEIKISPLLPYPLDATVNGKKLVVKIPDTLLKENTTYRITFGNAIKDLNEGNPLKSTSYMFSTGAYFDSLKVYGKVYDAESGRPAGDINVILYEAANTGDSVIVKEKPMYIARSNGEGNFLFAGLPDKAYRIYALKEQEENLVYDDDKELVGFVDSIIYPVDSVKLNEPIVLRTFKEIVLPDSADLADTVKVPGKAKSLKRRAEKESKDFSYSLNVDTTDVEKRVHDINRPVKITFSNELDTFETSRVFVTYDSTGIDVEAETTLKRDTLPNVLLLNTAWKENTVYTIRLLKDFATDTTKLTAMPSKYIFRTKADEDYGVLKVHVSSKYYGKKYLLKITTEKDSIYQRAITDSVVTIRRLVPEKYTMCIIVDENGNGKWDTGDLFAKKQPEIVIPYTEAIELKAGWENVLDFKEPVVEDPAKKKGRIKAAAGTPPNKGDAPGNK